MAYAIRGQTKFLHMKKVDLSKVTFMIPVRFDSIVRLENLLLSVNYLCRHFITNIIVLQAAKYDNGFVKKLLGNKVNYYYIEDYDNVFYRTKYLNFMTLQANTPYVAIWDADVIIPKEQLIKAIKELDNGSDVVYPYDGHFYDTSSIIRELYLKHQNVQILERNRLKMFMRYGNKMIGGAIFVNRQSYIASGMENIDFYGWGPEDGERYYRWEKLGFKIVYIKGHLFHLTHERGNDSKFRSIDQMVSTNAELMKLTKSNIEDVQNDIKKRKEHCNYRLSLIKYP